MFFGFRIQKVIVKLMKGEKEFFVIEFNSPELG